MRIQQIPTYDEKIHALGMSLDYASILCFKHVGNGKENPHFHLVIKTQVKMKAFRARMVKIFDLGKGNEHMSIKEWDGADEAYSYMYHEGGEPFYNHKILEADLVKYHDLNKKIQVLVTDAKGKASYLIEDLVLAQLTPGVNLSDFDIGVLILKTAFSKNKYHPNDFQLKLMIDRIQYRSRTDQYEQDMVLENIVRRALRMQ